MRKNRVLLLICLITLLVGCSKKSEYYIEKPQNNKFNMASVSEIPDSDVELIKSFLPAVVDWYDSIDISELQTIDFVTDEIDDLGHELCESEIYTSYLNDFASGNATEEGKDGFEQINKVNAIYGKIAEIMMTTEVSFPISEQSDATMTISEENWTELGDKIKEAIDYYYK